MKRHAPSLLLTCLLLFAILPALNAQKRGDPLSNAVDVKGVRHRGSDYIGPAPWTVDQIKTVAPQYPYAERTRHHAGSGLFRVTLDPATGSVERVTVVKSTGFPAFRRWRWKPGKWKEIDLPITFTMALGAQRLPPGARPIPPR